MIERHSSANHYSLSARYYSYKVSWELVQENKLTGVGIANLNREVRKQYIRNYEVIHKKMQKLPHNQFLWYLAAFGVIGFSIFMVAFYYPLFYRLNFKKDYFFFVQYVIVSLSFLIEGTLETQLGVTYSIFFILLPLNQIDKTKEAK